MQTGRYRRTGSTPLGNKAKKVFCKPLLNLFFFFFLKKSRTSTIRTAQCSWGLDGRKVKRGESFSKVGSGDEGPQGKLYVGT